MKFGPVPVGELEGLILAHSVRAGDLQYRKGDRVTAEMAAEMTKAGLRDVYAIELQADDVDEDAAAAGVATHLAGERFDRSEPTTGRVNLFAREAGLLQVDEAALADINRVDEGITVATLPAFAPVQKGQLVATVKVIPFAVLRQSIEQIRDLDGRAEAIKLAPFRSYRSWIILTRWPGASERLIDKSLRALGNRLSRLGSTILGHSIVGHEIGAIEKALQEGLNQGAELFLCLGASATADRRDVFPSAIGARGGKILRFGIPVDPGNLVLSAELKGCPVLVLPGSARSERRSGADWVLERTVAGLGLDAASLAQLGAGGLLKEMSSRPRPRIATVTVRDDAGAKIAGLLLAAGSSRRMKGEDKLLRDFHGEPLISRTAQALAGAGLDALFAVVRPGRHDVGKILRKAGYQMVENAEASEGMGASVRAGIRALPDDIDAVMIALGDMPLVKADTYRKLAEAVRTTTEASIAVPVQKGRRGNPVIFRREIFAALSQLSGDKGARQLIEDMFDVTLEVDVDDIGVLRDFDTEGAFERELGEPDVD